MENLNKENFFNEMKILYPDAMDHFCKWIDKYKKENDWDNLFNEGYHVGMHMAHVPKFHELPLAMQFGIITQYFGELNGVFFSMPEWSLKDAKKRIENTFELYQISYVNKKV